VRARLGESVGESVSVGLGESEGDVSVGERVGESVWVRCVWVRLDLVRV